MAAHMVEDPVLRQRYAFRRAAREDGTEFLEVDMWVDPGGGVTPHVHPSMEERFEVLAGRAEFLSGKTWTEAGAGEGAVIEAGVRHAFRNRGTEPAHVRCEASPPMDLEGFLTDVAVMSRAGNITRTGLPRNLTGLLQAAVLADHYRPMVVLLQPPPVVQRVALGPLVPIARRRGLSCPFVTPEAGR